MSSCCNHKPDFDGTSDKYKRILWIIASLNLIMFAVEIIAGHHANSKALQADALDFLGDGVTYLISLTVIGMALTIRAKAAILKAFSLAAFGSWTFISTIWAIWTHNLPESHIMGGISILAISVNLLSVVLLMKYREGDSNVRSVWLCSRNDAIGNLAVMMAAIAVFYTETKWPDLVVAFLMSGLFCQSAFLILRQAISELRLNNHPSPN